MEKQVIFLDVDGTLSIPKVGISEKVIQAIHQVRKNGHYVFVCTGRNLAGIETLRGIGFDGYICSAGGYIEYKKECIFEECMTIQETQRVMKLFDEHHILYSLEANDKTFQSEETNSEMVKWALKKDSDVNSEMQRMMNEFNIHPLKEYLENPIPIQKLSFLAQKEEELKEVKQLLQDKYYFIVYPLFSKETINGEIIPKTKDKGKAVEMVSKKLGISLENTIGFGDSMNDYQMLKTCHIGIAMENATEELKEHADCICESVYDDGIYHELKRRNII